MCASDHHLRELVTDEPRDAELLADMWNRSEAGWPGGFGGGVPYTAERAQREFMSWDCYAQWVVEYDDELVGYLSLLADPERPEHAYVALLNARPDHHGRGVGRMLLRRAVDAAIEGGFQMVQLNTWAGNLKAVPLYKKTGFFWSPETNVTMQNFVPTILRVPLLSDFFEDRDWYTIQKRDLSVREDVEWWRGIRVYRYRFAAGGREVEAIIDRQAQMLTAVHTDNLSIECWTGGEDLSAIQEHALSYRFVNRSERSLSLGLNAHGEGDARVCIDESFKLTGESNIKLPFRLPADMERKRPGQPPHRVLSTVTVDGVPIRLGSAVRMRQPVEIEYSGQGVAVGKSTEIHVRLRNRLPLRAVGKLHLEHGDEVDLECPRPAFDIAAESWAGIHLRLQAGKAGAHALRMQVELTGETASALQQGETPCPPLRGREKEVWVRAYAPGRTVVSRDEWQRRATVESHRQLVVFNFVGGGLSVRDKACSGDLLHVQMADVGPPFGGFSPLPELHDPELRRTAAGVEVVTRQEFRRWPGLWLERRVLIADGLLAIRQRVENSSEGLYAIKVKHWSRGHLNRGKLTVPLRSGLYQRPGCTGENWPAGDELHGRCGDYAENWVAAEDEGKLVGMVWTELAEVQPRRGGGGEVTWGPLHVPANSGIDLPPLYYVFSGADWKAARSFWNTFVNANALLLPEETSPLPDEILTGGPEHIPAILRGKEGRLVIVLRSVRQRPQSGLLRVKLPRGIEPAGGGRPHAFDVPAVSASHAFREELPVRVSCEPPFATLGEVEFSSARRNLSFPLPVIAAEAGAAAPTVEDEEGLIRVSAGNLAFAVSAEHGGSLTSLLWEGCELLSSSYPSPRPYQRMNPWYGGMHAAAGNTWDRRQHHVQRSVRTVTRTGEQGLTWVGACVHSTTTHRDLRWLRYETEFLASAGLNLLAVRFTIGRSVAAPMGTAASFEAWADEDAVRAFVLRDDLFQEYRPDQGSEYSVPAEGCVAFEYASGRMLSVICDPHHGHWMSLNTHDDGRMSASGGSWLNLTPPVERVTSLAWLAPCRSLDEARAYRYAARLAALP